MPSYRHEGRWEEEERDKSDDVHRNSLLFRFVRNILHIALLNLRALRED